MLLGPELCRAVESSGEVSRFTDARLREVAERAFANAGQGQLDADLLVASVEDDALRTTLTREHDEARKDRHQADDDMERRKRSNRHSKDHGALP